VRVTSSWQGENLEPVVPGFIPLGTPVEEVCRKMGISDATFYNWRKKYGGLGPSELRRLKPEISTAERYQNGVSLNTFPRKSA
jgi:hypothetical protein